MYSLKELVGMIADTIERRREGAVGCFSVRPKHVVGYRHPTRGSAVAYIFDVLARAGLAMRQELARGVKYLICRDSELYEMPKEEMARRIMQTVIEAEEKAWKKDRDVGHVTHTNSKPYEMSKEETTKRIVLVAAKA